MTTASPIEHRRHPRARRVLARGAARALAVLALGVLAAAAADRASAAPRAALGACLPIEDAVIEGWSWSGAWTFPVGDPTILGHPADDQPPFRVTRGLLADPSARRHLGVDLSNRGRGARVRAAAVGLVIHAGGGPGSGFGEHVVLAHRLPNGATAYSVYAHLARQSIRPKRGEVVAAGAVLGRVGSTGRASQPHLHFEVRLAEDRALAWERAPAVDPLAFVAARLPRRATDSTWAAPYLAWADDAGLLDGETSPDTPLTRAAWWRILARAARHRLEDVPQDLVDLRAALVALELLPETAPFAAGPLDLGELDGDLDRLQRVGSRLPPLVRRDAAAGPEDGTATAENARRTSVPTVAEACRALAARSHRAIAPSTGSRR